MWSWILLTDGMGIVMTRPRLTLKPNVLGGNVARQVDLTSLPGVSWRRTIGLQWGPQVGTFRIEGDESRLAEYMHNWLGMHLEERSRSVTWEGIVVDLTLRSRVVRRRSLENVWNKVRGKFGNLLENGSFETFDPGAPVFLYWTDTGGGVSSDSAGGQAGTFVAQINEGSEIYQDITVVPFTRYELSFYATGGGTQTGDYRIQNLTAGIDIIAWDTIDDNVSASEYRHVSQRFITPNNCVSVRIYLRLDDYGGSEGIFVDDVEVRRVEEGSHTPGFTDWETSQASVNAFGTKEMSIDGQEMGPTETARAVTNYLNEQAFPRLERLPQRGSGDRMAILEGAAIGYGLTTGWVYTKEKMFDSNKEAATLLGTLLGESEYFDSVVVSANTELIRLSMKEARLRQSIEDVVTGAGNGSYWRVYVRPGRVAVFEEVDFSPKYYLQGGELRSSLNGPIVDPYLVVPGIVRDVAYPRGAPYPNSPYQDRRDFMMDEVVVENGSLDWSVGDF